jgi:4-hydroxybenzoate polyprenyltransferase
MNTHANDPSGASIPLVVELDGALVESNALQEVIIQSISRQPTNFARAAFRIIKGRGNFRLADLSSLAIGLDSLTYNQVVIDAIDAARRQGRKVYLASAEEPRPVDEVARLVGTFDGVFASTNGVQLKGQKKADRLVQVFSAGGFDYIGSGRADIPIWLTARKALIAVGTPRLLQQLRAKVPNLQALSTRQPGLQAYIDALRPHQWLKNGLLALPPIAAHQFDWQTVVAVLTACVSFSLAASAVYLINDLLDLPHDRAHPQKRNRPLAAGLISIRSALAMSGASMLLAFALGFALPMQFIGVLLVYLSLSLGYSVYLKRKLMIDVVALAALYGTRVLAGGAATGIVLSHWLVGFCFFIFLSLALVKRTAEMIALPTSNVTNIKGRGYRREDLQTIPALAVASGFIGVLILALYVNSPEVRVLYHHPEYLWGLSAVLVYWLGRVYFLAGRGDMHHDPVVFAASDRISFLAGCIIVAIFLAAL